MTGAELREARFTISRAIGEPLSFLDMAALCGLSDPPGNGKDTIRKWESGEGPSGPVSNFLGVVLDGLDQERQPACIVSFFSAAVRHRVGITD